MKALVSMLWAAFCLCLGISAAQAQINRYPAVDCQRSFLALNPPLLCAVPRGVINDNKSSNKDYYTAGLIKDVSVYMVLANPPFVASIKPYSEQDSAALLKRFSDLTAKQGKDWSAIKTEGNSSYMNFKTEKEDCIAFDHAGPLKESGYAWALRGHVCVAAGRTISFDLVKTYLAATRVGNTRDNLNAYGQPVRPLTAKPQS